jgi:hypothetical protein
MFEQSALFVFTVGLTEAWIAISDGAVFPVAPGVVSNKVTEDRYRFVNFTVSEIIADLHAFIGKLRAVNTNVRLLFTVSPVPLVATYEDRHVLVSTTYSKSAIRAAVDEVVRQYDFVDYFPSYEVIAGWHNKGMYFANDLRSVTQEGVARVMQLFSSHYLESRRDVGEAVDGHTRMLRSEIADVAKIICDEELLIDGPKRLQQPKPDQSKPDLGRIEKTGLAAVGGAAQPMESTATTTHVVASDTQNQVSALHGALALQTVAQETQLLQVTRIAEIWRTTVASEVSSVRGITSAHEARIEALQTGQRLLQERLDFLTHGIEAWLLPTLEKHAAAIRRQRRSLFRRFARQVTQPARLMRLWLNRLAGHREAPPSCVSGPTKGDIGAEFKLRQQPR